MARLSESRATISPQDALAQATAERYKAMSSYKAVLDERGNALMAANESVGPRSKSYMSLAGKLNAAEAQLDRIAKAVRRPISRWQVGSGVMILIGIGLALLEAPANKFLFDVALQSSGIVSYAVSFGVTAFLLLLAHFAGRSIRQVWSDYRHKVIVSSILVFALCVVAAFSIMGVLTVARAAFASQTGTIGDLMTGITGNVQDLGPFGALVAALGDTAALVLACINLGGFVVTFMIAFFSHDSDRDFDHSQTAVERLEKQMAKLHGSYLKQRRELIKKFTPDLVGFAGNYDNANGAIIQLKTRLQMPLDEADHFVVTDLDQLSEDADREDRDEGHAAPAAPVEPRLDPSVTSMSDFRRQAAGEGS